MKNTEETSKTIKRKEEPSKTTNKTGKDFKDNEKESDETIKRQEETSKTMTRTESDFKDHKKDRRDFKDHKKTGRHFKHPIFQLSRPRSVSVTQTGATTPIPSLR